MEPLLWAPWGGTDEAGLGLARLSNFVVLGIGVVPGCLVPGPGVIWAGG